MNTTTKMNNTDSINNSSISTLESVLSSASNSLPAATLQFDPSKILDAESGFFVGLEISSILLPEPEPLPVTMDWSVDTN